LINGTVSKFTNTNEMVKNTPKDVLGYATVKVNSMDKERFTSA
jgi:hypothetical protein